MSLPQHLQLSSITTMNSSSNPYLIDQLHFMQNQEQQSYYQAADYLTPLDLDHCTPIKVTPSDRRIMCAWSYDIVDACSIDREIACIAMSYCDRFMSTTDSSKRARTALGSRREYQLAFIACLTIALKCRAGMQVDSEFVSDTICQGMYQPNEIVEMEREVLVALQWRVNGPSPHEFVDGFMELLPQSIESKNDKMFELLKALARVQVERALLDYGTAILSSPSSIAFKALMRAMSNIDSSVFPPLDRLAWMQNISLIMSSKENAVSDFGGQEDTYQMPSEASQVPPVTKSSDNLMVCPGATLDLDCSSKSKQEKRRYCSQVSDSSSCTSSMTSISVQSEKDSDEMCQWNSIY